MTQLTTFEEARRCPRCDNPGEDREDQQRKQTDGSVIHILRCMNAACVWFGTDWIVQVNPDNTVPVRGPQPKTFPAIPGMTTEKAQERISRMGDDEPKRGR